MNIRERALIARLTVSCWGATATDKGATSEILNRFEARQGSASVRKKLLSSDALSEVRAAKAALEAYHRRMTSPWEDRGERILNAEVYMEYAEEIGRLRHNFDAAVERFIENVELYKAESRNSLGRMFRESDYPKSYALRDKFGVAVKISKIPDTDFHAVLNLSEEISKELEEAARERERQTLQDSVLRDVYERIREAVKGLNEKLADEDNYDIRESSLNRLRDLVSVLPKLNVTDCPELQKMTEELEAEVTGKSIETLRYYPDDRSKAVRTMQDVLERIQGVYPE